jgi:hypothetical protein
MLSLFHYLTKGGVRIMRPYRPQGWHLLASGGLPAWTLGARPMFSCLRGSWPKEKQQNGVSSALKLE